MPSLYDRLRSGTVPKLLGKYKTGTVEIGRPVNTPGANSYDPPTITTNWTDVDAVVTGVAQKYVDGSNIVMSDRMVRFQSPTSFDIEAGDKLRVDGKVVAILMHKPILGAGDAVLDIVVIR